MCKKAASCAFSNFSILDLSRREVWYWNSIVLSCALGKSFKLSILQCKIENSMKKKLIFEMLLYNLYFWQFIWEFLFIFFFSLCEAFSFLFFVLWNAHVFIVPQSFCLQLLWKFTFKVQTFKDCINKSLHALCITS